MTASNKEIQAFIKKISQLKNLARISRGNLSVIEAQIEQLESDWEEKYGSLPE